MDISTLAVALGYTKKQVEQAKREGFRVQIEQDRSILETTGEEKIFYFLPKNSQKTKDGYDEFVYANNNWEQVGATDVDLSSIASGVVNQNGTISFYDEGGNLLFTTTGANMVTSGNQQIGMGYDNGGFYFLFDDEQEAG